MKGLISLIFVSFCVLHTANSQSVYSVCAYPPQHGFCDELVRGTGSRFLRCENVQDSVDCAWKIQVGKADFGAFFPEQALLASNFIDNDATVISEIREKGAENNKHSFRTVVVVKNDFTGNARDLRGKKYCHFGFDDSVASAATLRARQEFENTIVNIDEKCQKNKSIVEKEVEQYAKFFSQACRAGQWSEHEELDKQLKTKYTNLCELCDNKQQCSYNDNSDPGKNALKCLVNTGADVAYTTLAAVLEFNKADANFAQNYKLLCKDGNTVNINSPGDCTWKNEPWSLILGRNDKAQEISKQLQNEWLDPKYILGKGSFERAKQDQWKEALKNILTAEGSQKLFYFIDNNRKMSEYLVENKQQLSDLPKSKCEMRWCTVSQEEKDKCDWLKKAADIFGIKPSISCFQAERVYGCLKTIREDKADMMAIDSQYGFIARKYGHLRTLMNVEEQPANVTKVYTLVKVGANINKFEDMKNKKACFPEYRGLAWLAFIAEAREKGTIPDKCDYGKSIGEYFSGVCAPGVKDQYHARSKGADDKKLCSLCKKTDSEQQYCEANENNRYYNNTGALRCLKDGTGDVAFVELRDLEANENFNGVQVLCKNGDLININNMDDVKNLPEDCPLIAAVNSEIVSKETNLGNADFIQVLEMIDKYFGNSASRKDKTMNVFSSFKGTHDLLFKENVNGFSVDTSNIYVSNYKKLFESVDKCTPSAASAFLSSVLLVLFMYFLTNF